MGNENKEFTHNDINDNLEHEKEIKKTNDEEKGEISYIALGLCFGCTFGIIFKNLALFLSLGVLLGVVLDGAKNNKNKK